MATASPAPETEAADPTRQERIELARGFASQLLKGIKQIGMYRHNEAKFSEFLAPALQALLAYQAKYQALSLKVDAQNFMVLGQPLFAESSSLPYKFFRDGIRQLIFRPDVTVDELVTFTLIAISEPERGADDVLAQLWRASLEHVEYLLVEGFQMDEFSEEQVQVEVDQIVGYLYSRLQGNSEDFLRFARVSTDDLDVKLDGIEQIRGAVITGVTADDTLKARLQREIEEEETARLFPKLVSAVFQVVEGGLDDAALLEEIFTQILDALLLQEDFSTINQIVAKLKAIEQRGGYEALSKIRVTLIARMGEEQRLTRVAGILTSRKAKSAQDIVRYLQTLDSTAMAPLLSVVESIEIPENRTIVLDAISSFAAATPDPIIERLQADRPQTVRDMVYVIEKINHPDRFRLFGQVLKHRNLAVRLDVMGIIARGRTGENRRFIVEALSDGVPQVRMLAARLLSEFDGERAYADLAGIVKEASFDKKPPEERSAFYAALGHTGVTKSFELLGELLAAKPNLLNRKKVIDDKLLVVNGLGTVNTLQSYKALQAIVDDRAQPVEILNAARKALYQTKKSLFGDTGEPEAH